MSNYTLDTAKLDELIRTTPDRGDAWLADVAERIVAEIKGSFGSSPSSPGEPPGVVTGELKDSIRAVFNGESWSIEVGAEHGLPLEFGTENIEPRPFLTPVMHEWEQKLGDDAVEFGIIK